MSFFACVLRSSAARDIVPALAFEYSDSWQL